MTTVDRSDPIASAGTYIPTVLFVDDEEDVLSGVRLSLRRHRNDYRLLFASSADDAMDLLNTEPVDMVVTDMRMPDRTGADLLEEVRFQFPGVIRYVLSGQAGDRLVQRSVAVTHRWLSKPCDSETLASVLAEATGHRATVIDPNIRRAVGVVDALPSHPVVHAGLVELFTSGEATIDGVTTVAAGDPAFLAKLLQWANSVYAGSDRVYDLRRAVEHIGLEALSQLVVANDIVRPVAVSEVVPGFDVDIFHRHARSVAAIAAGLTGPEDADLAAAGGLLSKVGLLVEVGYLRDRLDLAYQRAVADGVDLAEAERANFIIDNIELGAHLLALWGLPGPLVEIVAQSGGLPNPAADLPLSPVDAVRAARLLAQRLPLAVAMGKPHLVEIDEVMASALDRWAARLHGLDVDGIDDLANR